MSRYLLNTDMLFINLKCKWEDNFKLNLKEIRSKFAGWICQNQGMIKLEYDKKLLSSAKDE